MEQNVLLAELLDLAEKLKIEVRHEFLGGEGGGLCCLRGQQVLFVDTAASLPDQLAQSAKAMSGLPGLEDQYILPQVRQIIDQFRDE